MTQWTSPTAESGATDNRNATTEFVAGEITTTVSALSISTRITTAVSTAIVAISVSTQISVAIAGISTSQQITNALTNVGTLVQASVSASTNLTSGAINVGQVMNVALSAGDYDCWGTVVYSPNGSLQTAMAAALTTVAALTVMPVAYNAVAVIEASTSLASAFGAVPTLFGGNYRMQCGPLRVTGPVTLYLLAQSTFTGGTVSTTGYLEARRVK